MAMMERRTGTSTLNLDTSRCESLACAPATASIQCTRPSFLVSVHLRITRRKFGGGRRRAVGLLMRTMPAPVSLKGGSLD